MSQPQPPPQPSTPTSNTNSLHQAQPHVCYVPGMSQKSLNPNQTFNSYSRTWSSAICLKRTLILTKFQHLTSTPTMRLVHTRELEVQQFVSQEHQSKPHFWCVPENLKFSKFNKLEIIFEAIIKKKKCFFRKIFFLLRFYSYKNVKKLKFVLNSNIYD